MAKMKIREISLLLAEPNVGDKVPDPILTDEFTPEKATTIKRITFDAQALTAQPLPMRNWTN